jgi:hypothetical protein
LIYIKSKREIDYIRESCKIVAETLQLLKKYVKPGITTGELDKIANDSAKVLVSLALATVVLILLCLKSAVDKALRVALR